MTSRILALTLLLCILGPIALADEPDPNRSYRESWRSAAFLFVSGGGVLDFKEADGSTRRVLCAKLTSAEKKSLLLQLPKDFNSGKPIPVMLYDANRYERKIQDMMSVPSHMEWLEMPLIDIIDYTKEIHEISCNIDLKMLRESGIDPDKRITVSVSGLLLEESLKKLLEPLGLSAIIYCDALFITTQKEAARIEAERMKPPPNLPAPKTENERKLREALRDLARVDSTEMTLSKIISELAEEHSIYIDVDPDALLGPTAIKDVAITDEVCGSLSSVLTLLLRPYYLTWRVEGEKIFITRTKEEAPFYVAASPRKISNMRIGFAPQSRSSSEAIARSKQAMTTTIDEYLVEISLHKVLDQFASHFDVAIHLDDKSLKPVSRVDYFTTVPLTDTFKGKTLKQALEVILDPLNIRAVVFGEVLLITTHMEARRIESLKTDPYPTIETSETPKGRRLRSALSYPIEIGYRRGRNGLADYVADLRKLYDIEIGFDKDSFEGSKIMPDVQVSFQIKDVSFRCALTLLLRDQYMSWRIEEDRIVIYRTDEAIPDGVYFSRDHRPNPFSPKSPGVNQPARPAAGDDPFGGADPFDDDGPSSSDGNPFGSDPFE